MRSECVSTSCYVHLMHFLFIWYHELSSTDDRKEAIKLLLWLWWRNIPFFKREYSTADVRCAILLPSQLSLPFECCFSPLPSALRQLPLCWPASKRMADSSEWVFNFTCLTMFPASNLQCQAKASGQEGQNLEPGTRGWDLFSLCLLINTTVRFDEAGAGILYCAPRPDSVCV